MALGHPDSDRINFIHSLPRLGADYKLLRKKYILSFFPEDSAGELVGARCRLSAAGVAQEFCRDIFGAHAFAEFGNRLQVAVASARKADVPDFVSVARELNRRCANASGLESLFHTCLVVEGMR